MIFPPLPTFAEITFGGVGGVQLAPLQKKVHQTVFDLFHNFVIINCSFSV